MNEYRSWILNKLLDSYERSLLFTGENKRLQSIRLRFEPKTVPEYFDESGDAFLQMHDALNELQDLELVTIHWKNGRPGHIVSSVDLRSDHLARAYDLLGRIPKQEMISEMMTLLAESTHRFQTPVCQTFLLYLMQRIPANASVRDYVDIRDPEETKHLIRGIYAVECNRQECYLREFSVRTYQDSKAFEERLPRILRIFRDFGGWEQAAPEQILSEYNIYRTPNYVYLKGPLTLRKGDAVIDLCEFRQGIGISGEDLPNIRFSDLSAVDTVLTIENLTTFFRWEMDHALIIYLGGYHNALRRSLLQTIYREKPQARYLHFGDIDAGGFDIWEDLCRQTGIPFQRYKMNLPTLKRYESWGKPLTASDAKRLRTMLDRAADPDLQELLHYMLEHNVKLEQECLHADLSDV